MQNFSQSKNKLHYAYLLTPAGVAEKSKLTAEFLKRKVAEYETLQAEIEALRAEVESVRGALSESYCDAIPRTRASTLQGGADQG